MDTGFVSITRDRLQEAADLLAAAFDDYPSNNYILRAVPPGRRSRKLRRLYRLLVDTCRRHGKATGVLCGHSLAGVSLAYPPGTLPSTWQTVVRSFLDVLLLGPSYAWRYAQLDAHQGGHRRQWEVSQTHWYLLLLGVAPSAQGQGFGGRLLARLSEQAEDAREPCFLETERSKNVGIYRKYGYEVVAESEVARLGNLKIWHMRRPPQPGSTRSGEDRPD
jgi:GNAT superfamily N-acetyltransferase